MAAPKKQKRLKQQVQRQLTPEDVSKLSMLAYSLRSTAPGAELLQSFEFKDSYAREVARALVGAKTTNQSAKRAAAAMSAWSTPRKMSTS